MGTLAHDIRNPLSAALIGLKMLSFDGDAARFGRIQAFTERSVKRALELVEGLMDGITVRAGRGLMMDFGETDLVECVRWVHDQAAAIHGQRIDLVCHDEKVIGTFDNVSIRRLLENLLTNAIKYGDGGRPITISLEDGDGHCQLSVHNFGEPVPSAERETLFEFLKSGGMNRRTIGAGHGPTACQACCPSPWGTGIPGRKHQGGRYDLA